MFATIIVCMVAILNFSSDFQLFLFVKVAAIGMVILLAIFTLYQFEMI